MPSESTHPGDPEVLVLSPENPIRTLVVQGLESAIGKNVVLTEREAVLPLLSGGSGSIDCVVCEYHLPDGNGVELLRSVREQSAVPFVLFTDDGSEAIASEATAAGVDRYVPIDGVGDTNRIVDTVTEVVTSGPTTGGRGASGAAPGLDGQGVSAPGERIEAGLFALDQQDRFTYVNSRASELLSRPAEDLLGVEIWEAFDPEGNEPFYENYQRAKDQGATIHFEAYSEQLETWFEMSIYPGRPGLSVYFRDTSEWREPERLLHHERSRANLYFELADVVMVALDEEGIVTRINRRGSEILGYEREAIVGKRWFETVLPERVREETREVFDSLIDGEGEAEEHYRNPVVTADGEERIIEWHNTVLRDEEGDPTGTLSSGQDVTDRIRDRRRYRAMAENIPNGTVTLIDPDLRYEVVHGELFDELSLDPEMLEGNRADDVLPPEFAHQLTPLYRDALAGERSEGDVTVEDRTLRVIVQPIRDDKGEIVGAMGLSQDVTRQRRTQAELEERETHLKQAQTVANLGSWEFDIRNDEAYWSDAAHTIFGRSPREEDLDMETFLSYVHPEDRRAVVEEWTTALEGGSYDIEHRIVVDGETKWVRGRAEMEFDEDGDPRRAVGIVQDVTQRKDRQQELERTNRRYRTLLDNFPDGFVTLFDENHRFQIVGGQGASNDGFSIDAEDLEGKTLAEVFPPENAERLEPLFDAALDGESNAIEVTLEGRTFLVTVEPVCDRNGQVFAGMTLSRDVTEERQYEDTLATLNEASTELRSAETVDEVASKVVDITLDATGLPFVALYQYDDREGVLRPAACSDAFRAATGDPSTHEPGESIIWEVFDVGTPRVVAFNSSTEGASPLPEGCECARFIPLGEDGVLTIGGEATAPFDDKMVEISDLVAMTAEAAIDRAVREEALRNHKQTLSKRNEQLNRANQLIERTRTIRRLVVEAESRDEIERTVCDYLSEIDHYRFTWIGGTNDPSAKLVMSNWSGGTDDYRRVQEWFETAPPPDSAAVRAIEEEHPVAIRVPDGAKSTPWRRSALEHGLSSALAVPITYKNVTYGVFVVYADTTDAFDERTRSVLEELGSTIGHAITAVDRKLALLNTGGVQIDVTVENGLSAFETLGNRLDCHLVLENVIQYEGGISTVVLRLSEVGDANLESVLEGVQLVDDFEVISRSDNVSEVQITLREPFVGGVLANFGGRLQSLAVRDGVLELSIDIPRSTPSHVAIDAIESLYGAVSITAKRDRGPEGGNGPLFNDRIAEALTKRQLEVLTTAYHGGFYADPRGNSAEELATSLGISEQAFYQHLRSIRRKLITNLFETNAF